MGTTTRPIASLAFFRIIFGFMMLVGTLRFLWKGWVHQLYIAPQLHFPYYGFEWVQVLPPAFMYALFVLMALSALGILLGFAYRASAWIFFLSFTYVELIDKSNYLNHYYFVSIAALLMALLPAHGGYSLDAKRNPEIRRAEVPAWMIWALQLQLSIVYWYAGIAKLQPEWLLDAMPLKIWLKANIHLPIIGPWLGYGWVAYAFSWAGALYDCLVPFFLFYKKTRLWAYMAVVAFHLLTGWLFPIGMFPFIMIAATLIFFPSSWHQRLLDRLIRAGHDEYHRKPQAFARPLLLEKPLRLFFAAHFALQLLLPWRFLLYPGQLLWTEQGYRFSWRVMLTEKAGFATFTVRDPGTGHTAEVTNSDYLLPQQEKMMSFQPDMILQFAHFLEQEYKRRGVADPQVYAQVLVSFNGRRSQPLVDPTADLTQYRDGLHAQPWILGLDRSGATPVHY